MKYEYRVTYRRVGWNEGSADQSRFFQSRDAADRFVDKLCGNGRPDLSRIAYVHIHHRRVDAWMEGWS